MAGEAPDQSLDPTLVGANELLLGRDGARAAVASWRDELVGLGPLEALTSDPSTTDVLVNGDGWVWVDRGTGVVRTPICLGGPAEVRRLATRLAGLAGRRLDDSQPWVDAELGHGIRLHAVLPPVAHAGAHVSLRLARRAGWDLEALAARDMFSPRVHAVLQAVVSSRVSFVVTGGTGTGKTALLSAMLAASDPGDRIVVVEDVRELVVHHPHVVSLQGRSPNVEGVGSVTLVDLVRQALRMRPDRLVVGEARGAELREMLAALNTGHEGGCATLHANRAIDVPSRVAALGALAGLDGAGAMAQFTSGVHSVIHLARGPDGRRVGDMAVVRSDGVLPALTLDASGTCTEGPGLPGLRELIGDARA